MTTRYALHQRVLLVLILFGLSAVAFSATWEETDGLFFARGDLDAVKRILAKERYSGDLLIDALSTAVRSGNVDLVKYLDGRGWITQCRKAKGCDTITPAVQSKNLVMLSFMLSQGFSVTRTSLLVASSGGNLDAVKLLCEKGANPNEKDQYLTSPVAQTGTVLEELKDRINSPRMDLGSPLRSARGLAAEVKVAEFFKKGQCKARAAGSYLEDTYSKEVKALREGDLSSVKKLLAQRNTAEDNPDVQAYLLYEAIASGNTDLLQHLKNLGWFERCRKNHSCRPIDVAAEVGVNINVFKLLVAEGFELDTHNMSEGTPLLYATVNGHLEAVKYLCQHGADFRKKVKLEIYDRSIISALRRSYGNAWCASVLGGKEAINDSLRDRCEGPWSIVIAECVPGSTCMSIPFPPKGPEQEVRHVVAVSEVFQYLKDGHCKSAQTDTCLRNTAKTAAVIGDNVNLRAEPLVTSGKVETLPFGTIVKVLNNSKSCETVSGKSGRWIKIKVHEYVPHTDPRQKGIEGWVFDAYVDYLPAGKP